MSFWTVIDRYFPFPPERILETYFHKLASFIYPYDHITVHEDRRNRFKRSEAYDAIEAYLSAYCSQNAHRLKGELGEDGTSLVLSVDDHEEVTDEFEGTKFWWFSSVSFDRNKKEDKRSYRLTFHRSNQGPIVHSYLNRVIKEGREVRIENRRSKLYSYDRKGCAWSHVVFAHPSKFETLAMDPGKKQEIMEDLATFRNGKDYYAKIGKAWKRGYLLYGPPGTGKSSMVAAMANFLKYDVYDLELTAVKDNTDLRKLFIETTNRSIIVIEDIDCSLDLTGKRKKKSKKEEDESEKKKNLPPGREEEESSKVTLSGLLNFIDGLWSACGGERLMVFTTNDREKLDPSLIRRGRMDIQGLGQELFGRRLPPPVRQHPRAYGEGEVYPSGSGGEPDT